MVFKPTPDFIFNLLNEAAAGNPGPLTEALDPEVKWRIATEVKDDVAKTGIYVRARSLLFAFSQLMVVYRIEPVGLNKSSCHSNRNSRMA